MNSGKAQTTVLIYQQDFESSTSEIMLNADEPGMKSYGNNKWIINDSYDGDPVYQPTPDESQTEGGTIYKAPHSKYLHIHDIKADQDNGVSNCNYNPADSSDRFVQLSFYSDGLCTLGATNVKIAFFYIGQGSQDAYAELWYSTDRGPWKKTGTVYNNQSKWKYEVVSNPDFNNKSNLRFGFRWVNKKGSVPGGNTSIGIDDIFIKGDFDNFSTNFNLVIDSVSPKAICQNFALNVYYHLTVPLCGWGFTQVQLSDANGNFSPGTSLGIMQIDNQEMKGVLNPIIPSSTVPGTCYKVKIEYYYTFYGLDFFTSASACFEVKHCPNTITTLQPLVTKSAPDSVCIGSVIDIPFFSTGVFGKNNVYTAQLSDENGNFPDVPNVLGESKDKNTYDPNANPPSGPGGISGTVNEAEHDIKDGCKYYIRVISSNPVSVGEVFGPFCIKHCDIETNNRKDIQVCLHTCAYDPNGFNYPIHVKIHKTDSTAIYAKDNQFKIEVLDMKYLKPINPVGGMGKITWDNDSTFRMHVPCLDSLGYMGIMPGMYYMRIIGTNSNQPYKLNGTIVRLFVGAPADNMYIFQYPSGSQFCVGDAVYFDPYPPNYLPPKNSTYEWFMNGTLFSKDPQLGILFLFPGTINITVQETNYGCKGPVTPNDVTFTVLSVPKATVSGPEQICIGDIIHYQVPFQSGVYYEWTTSGGEIVDTTNNLLNIKFKDEGVYDLKVNALNRCGQAEGTKTVIASAHPDAKFSSVSPVCMGDFSVIQSTGTSSPPLSYLWNFDGGVNTSGGKDPLPNNVYWNEAGRHKVSLALSKYGCITKDSAYIDVLQKPVADFGFDLKCLDSLTVFSDSSKYNPVHWLWNYGDNHTDTIKNPSHKFDKQGSYNAELIVRSADGCKDTIQKVLKVELCDIKLPPIEAYDIITPNKDGDNDVFKFKELDKYPDTKLLIYNRWGIKIYESDDYKNDWDGENHPAGVYYYILIPKNAPSMKGTVTIIR